MRGWLSFAASGPPTWMLSNATSIAGIGTWIRKHQRNGKLRRRRRGPTRERDKGETNENQTDQRIRGRPKQGPALLHRGTGLCQEGRFQSGLISVAHRGLARGAGRHRTAAGAEQQSR